MLSNNTVCYRELFVKERVNQKKKKKKKKRVSQSMWQSSLLSYFKKLPQPPPTFSNHQERGKILQQKKDYDLLKAQVIVSIF